MIILRTLLEIAAILLNAGAADYVITGCGTGEGAMLALNSFPGVICGHVATPLDAYTFAQINDGNAISLPFALGFGWVGVAGWRQRPRRVAAWAPTGQTGRILPGK